MVRESDRGLPVAKNFSDFSGAVTKRVQDAANTTSLNGSRVKRKQAGMFSPSSGEQESDPSEKTADQALFHRELPAKIGQKAVSRAATAPSRSEGTLSGKRRKWRVLLDDAGSRTKRG